MAAASLSSIERAIARCVSRRPEIQAAYIFGSVATRRTWVDSDLDVAVLLRRSRKGRMLSYRLTLMADLRSALHRSDVFHEYLEIDRRGVYQMSGNELGDFEKFIKAISKLL